MRYYFDSVDERCVIEAKYVIETGATVRKTAAALGISKSTVHKDLTQRLKTVDRSLYTDALNVIMRNKEERHLRGGEATRLKYKKKDDASPSIPGTQDARQGGK